MATSQAHAQKTDAFTKNAPHCDAPNAHARCFLGLRRTKPREAVVRVVRESSGTLSAAQVFAQARQLEPGLGAATVYRTLRLLQEVGMLRLVSSPHEGARYEVPGETFDRKILDVPVGDHFECRHCQRAFPLQTEVALDVKCLGLANGFLVEGHELTLHGLCPRCISPQNGESTGFEATTHSTLS